MQRQQKEQIMYEKIAFVNKLISEIGKLTAQHKDLKRPILTDLSLLRSIKRIVEGNLTGAECKTKTSYYFIPVVVMLYSPRCFMGQRMDKGLRRAISVALDINTPTTISHVLTASAAWLEHNKEFRVSVDRLYAIVLAELEDRMVEGDAFGHCK